MGNETCASQCQSLNPRATGLLGDRVQLANTLPSFMPCGQTDLIYISKGSSGSVGLCQPCGRQAHIMVALPLSSTHSPDHIAQTHKPQSPPLILVKTVSNSQRYVQKKPQTLQPIPQSYRGPREFQ